MSIATYKGLPLRSSAEEADEKSGEKTEEQEEEAVSIETCLVAEGALNIDGGEGEEGASAVREGSELARLSSRARCVLARSSLHTTFSCTFH